MLLQRQAGQNGEPFKNRSDRVDPTRKSNFSRQTVETSALQNYSGAVSGSQPKHFIPRTTIELRRKPNLGRKCRASGTSRPGMRETPKPLSFRWNGLQTWRGQ